MSGQIGRQRKSFSEQSLGDMARSMLLLVLIVGVIWFVGSLGSDEPVRESRPVDYSGQLASARDLADYPVVAPRGLDSGWVSTSVELEETGGSVRWHLGFLTPSQEYVGLEQTDIEPEALARRHLGKLSPQGALTVDGRPWRLYTGETDSALVRRVGEVITVVVGTAPTDTLVTFAASLS